MSIGTRCWLTLIAAIASSGVALGDQYGRLEGDALERLTRSQGSTKRPSLSFREIEALPNALSDNRSTLVVIKTNDGNYSKLLLSPAFRKRSSKDDALTPVLLVERLQTLEPGKRGSRLANSAGMILFNGFRADLDIGQIVPADEGEDLVFDAVKPGDEVLKPVGNAELWTINEPLKFEKSNEGPSEGRTILASDFNGRFDLEADGRWKGLLELTVADDKQVTGQFRSEPNGTSYPLKGQVSSDVPHKIAFTIRFPRVEQEFEGYLATEGKSSLAGIFVMEGRTYGFHADREGSRDRK